jgi:hypothetical protein
VTQAGRIEIRGAEDATWQIALQPDQAPEIAFDGPISRAASGEMTQPFAARDDFGVTSGEAVISLDLARVDRRHGLAAAPEPRDDIVAGLPMPITGDRDEFTRAMSARRKRDRSTRCQDGAFSTHWPRR